MWVSGIPKIINAGSTIKWRDETTTVPIDQQVTSTDWTLTYYLRSAEAGSLTVVSSAYNHAQYLKRVLNIQNRVLNI